MDTQPVFEVSGKLDTAVRFHQQGDLLKAGRLYREILDQYPDHADTLHLAGLLAQQQGDNQRAVELIARAVHLAKDNPFYHHDLGLAFLALGNAEKASACYRKALSIHPRYAEAHYNLGAVLQLENQFDRALDCYRQALAIQPDLWEAYSSIAIIRQARGEFESAAQSLRQAIEIRPRDAELWHRRGRMVENGVNLDEAVKCYRQALEIEPGLAEVYNDMGLVLKQQGKFVEALASLQKAVEIDPACIEALNSLGNLHQDGGRLEAAAECYRKALALRPDFVEACNNLGVVYQGQGRSQEAVTCFRKAVEIKPDHPSAWRHLVHQLQKDCSWPDMAAASAVLDRLTRESLDAGLRPAEDPFLSLSRHMEPACNAAVARAWSTDIHRRMAAVKTGFSFVDRRGGVKPITIGYLSNNFHDHPLAHLLLGLFNLHDRSRFKINCYSCGKEDDSLYRQRIRRECDKFVDMRRLGHLEAARAIHDDGVDILVDLMGHTKGSRMEICALRPAPIQVRYLGLAGTTGADFFDYLLTDRIVTPQAQAPHYSENFAYLPHCYQVNDYRQTYGDVIAVDDKSKTSTDPFIFCSFNQDYKIDPVMFDCWMQILRRVPNSVLWLMVRSPAAKNNLRNEAQSRRIDPDRLVFVERRSKSEHLARLSTADLALDTRVVNGAATTSDALWAGVPVITLKGSHFASRMSASILTAIGLPELIADSIEAYETLAVQVALAPDRLTALRRKLVRNRLTEPLFDTPRFVSNLELAFTRMWQTFQAGSQPHSFEVVEPAVPAGETSNGQRGESNPESEALAPSGIEVQAPVRKIAFFCGPNDTFLMDISNHLGAVHAVRRFKGRTLDDMHAMMKWSDIAWFEWCDQLAVQASKLPKVCRMLCRLHSYEVFTEMPGQVEWKNIDDLIFVAPHIRDIAMANVADLARNVRTHVIPNGLNIEECRFRERSKGFDLAYVGFINHKKNPALLLQCMRYLVDIDDRYRLHIAGEHQELRFKLYFEHMVKALGLQSHIRLYGWVDDVVSWFEDKQYIVSTSLLESFGYGIAEGMACGLKPVIHNFVGAKALYPSKYCFNSIKEFGAKVLESDYDSGEYRRYIEDHYSLTKQLRAIDSLIENCRSKESEPAISIAGSGRE